MKTISIYIHKYISMKNMIKWYLNIILLKYVKKLYSFLRWFNFRILKNVMFLLKKDILKDFFFTIPAQIFLTRIILNLKWYMERRKNYCIKHRKDFYFIFFYYFILCLLNEINKHVTFLGGFEMGLMRGGSFCLEFEH